MKQTSPLLRKDGLRTVFGNITSDIAAVDGVDVGVPKRRTLGIDGKSDCGKSVLSLSVMRLVAWLGRVAAGRMIVDGRDLLALNEASAMLHWDANAMLPSGGGAAPKPAQLSGL